ncbi:class I SAM-dependent methyltransferase [Alkalicoccus luteus]|uniref:Methyltransferase domain-containing protein n=1 Tax=Alkalicoccus luteus TaxID=1237094 RepID=A0A969TUC5_9BACI|nr:methyltransferase domain-containing protein [Alkalicoccus luteus]
MDNVLHYAKKLAADVLPADGIAIDATTGNGHDTVFLARLASNGKVYSFDIQKQALDSCREKLAQEQLQAELIHDGHEHAEKYVEEEGVHVVMFNLGYLPGGPKDVTTHADSTIGALTFFLEKLLPGGRIILVVYHGHEEGKAEKEELLPFLQSLPQHAYQVLQYGFINQKNDPPFICAIEKRRRWKG